MKLIWQIEESDIAKAKAFYEKNKNNIFVKNRIKRNVNNEAPGYSRDLFWEAMVSCLLTTQQRSGPDSHITNFICTVPFPLGYTECKASNDLKHLVEKVLTDFGGIRRAKSISEQIERNYIWLEGGGWKVIEDLLANLLNSKTAEVEKKSAQTINKYLYGFGPKQSRNLLQMLGLTKYEIPIDSRITKWLNAFGFPIKLSAAALGDIHYYNFVQDGFQKICEACEIYPCVMDAVIFSSFDTEWPEDLSRY